MAARTPVSREAEQELLSGMLRYGEAREFGLHHVSAEDFTEPSYKTIFEVLGELAQGGPVDEVMLRHGLEERGLLDKVGGREALQAISDACSSIPETAMAMARKVRGLAIRRRAMGVGIALHAAATDLTRTTEDIIDEAENHLAELRAGGGREAVPIGKILDRLMERLRSGKPLTTGLKTGFRELDALTGGLHAGELILLASRPGVGKSTFAANLMERMGRPDKRIVLYSLEMSGDEIVIRLMASHSGVSHWSLRQESMGSANMMRLEAASASLAQTGIYLDDPPVIKLADLRSAALDIVNRRGVVLVVVDYLQLVQGVQEKGYGRYREVASVSHGLKSLARQAQVPVLAVAALRRPPSSERAKLPNMDSLRESGDLEQDADVVMLLHRDPAKPTEAKLLLVKQRNGPTGIMDLVYREEFTRFEDAAPAYHRVEPPPKTEEPLPY